MGKQIKTNIRTWVGIGILLAIIATLPQPLFGQPVEQLKPFEQFIGAWELDNSVQVFEWGVGKTSFIGKSYRINSDQSKTLVSGGMWIWHPGEQEIKGYITATNMPVSFFDYTTKFENGKMISDLLAYDKNGNPGNYQETMEIRTDSTYSWALFQQGETVMEGIFTRVNEQASD